MTCNGQIHYINYEAVPLCDYQALNDDFMVIVVTQNHNNVDKNALVWVTRSFCGARDAIVPETTST